MSIPQTDFVVVDTETTGGSAASNRLIEIAGFHVRDGIILGKFQTLLNPGRPIPSWITLFTGIDDSMVRDAPSFTDVAADLRNFLDRGVFAAHNASFDYNFIRYEFGRLGQTWERPRVCTLRIARKMYPELPSRSLGPLCEHFLIDIFDRHRAAGDAEATIYVLKHLLKEAQRLHGVETLDALEAFLKTRKQKIPPPPGGRDKGRGINKVSLSLS